MAQRGSGVYLKQLGRLFEVGTLGGTSDGQLLARFVGGSGESPEAAFEALVDRHGPMVLRVCRGVLRDAHDAEDAFQATFLVLVRRARAIRRRESVASWLHGVALRVATRAKARSARRRDEERRAASLAASTPGPTPADPAWIWAELHEEIDRLPDRYRAPIVLCDLEGCTHEEAARRLGCPPGTVKTRLVRARRRLHGRLTRRGYAPAAEALAALPALGPTAVPMGLVHATVQAALPVAAGPAASAGLASAAAATLAEGVLKAMFLHNLKLGLVAILATASLCTGAGILARQASGDPPRPRVGEVEGARQKGVGQAVDWPRDPAALLKKLKVRDAGFDNRSIETEQRWVEKVSPRGQIAASQFDAHRFGEKDFKAPPDEEIPADFDQPHRLRHLLTVREPEVTIERLVDLEPMKHSRYVAIPNRGCRWSSAGGIERVWSPETNDLQIRGKPSRDGLLRSEAHMFAWCCGYGVARWMESIDALRVDDDRLVVKGRIRLLDHDDSRVEMELDRDLVIRRAVISIPAQGGGGFDEYVVETRGTARPEYCPPVAQSGHYGRILRPEGQPGRVYYEYDVLLIAVSSRLTDEQYAERTRIEPKPNTRIIDSRRKD